MLKRIGAGLWLAGVLPLVAQERDPFDPLGKEVDMPQLVRVQVEFVETSHETLTRLMAEPRESSDDTELRKELAGLVEKDEARVVETMMCITRSGEKATVESIEEFIYPTEYEPAELPNTITVPDDGTDTEVWVKGVATGPTPTAFETRNLGSTLEIAPVLGMSGKIIDLSFAPEIVYHVKNETWVEWKDIRGEAPIQMPIMYSLRLNTAVTLLDGQTLMAAALSPRGEDGFPDFSRKIMVFVRCDVLGVGR